MTARKIMYLKSFVSSNSRFDGGVPNMSSFNLFLEGVVSSRSSD